MWHCHPSGSPLRLQPFVATPSRLLPWGALIGKDTTDSSLERHLAFARANGATQTEMAELLTHISLKAV